MRQSASSPILSSALPYYCNYSSSFCYCEYECIPQIPNEGGVPVCQLQELRRCAVLEVALDGCLAVVVVVVVGGGEIGDRKMEKEKEIRGRKKGRRKGSRKKRGRK